MTPTVKTMTRPNIRQWMLAIGMLAVLPMVVFSALVGRSLLNQQQAALEAELQQQADFAARELAREARVIFATLDSLATSDAALRADYAALHAHATRIVAITPRIGGVAVFDADSMPRFSTLLPFATPLPVILPTDTDKKVLVTGTRQISPLFVAPLSGKKQVLFMVPVKHDGKTVMILRASMWTESIAEIVYEQPLPPTWLAAVADQNMIQIARSKEASKWVGTPLTEFSQAAIRAGQTTPYAAIAPDGVALTASISRVAGTPWTVVVAAPSTSLQSEVWQAFQSTLWIGLICAALSLIGVWVLALKVRNQVRGIAPVDKSGDSPLP